MLFFLWLDLRSNSTLLNYIYIYICVRSMCNTYAWTCLCFENEMTSAEAILNIVTYANQFVMLTGSDEKGQHCYNVGSSTAKLLALTIVFLICCRLIKGLLVGLLLVVACCKITLFWLLLLSFCSWRWLVSESLEGVDLSATMFSYNFYSQNSLEVLVCTLCWVLLFLLLMGLISLSTWRTGLISKQVSSFETEQF